MNALLIPLIVAIVLAIVFVYAYIGVKKRTATKIAEIDAERTLIKNQLTEEKAQHRATQTLLSEQKEQTSKLSEELTGTLTKNLQIAASTILEERTKKLNETNNEELGKILNPLKTKLDSFEKRINEIHSLEQTQHGSLKTELQQLARLNASLSKEASDLTQALRGNSKTQGDWGEMILDRLLEASGLIRGTHYSVQENLKDEAGHNLRPDVILRLPDEKPIVIDSKVSLTAYTNYINADDEATAKSALAAHVGSVRAHIKELKGKDYSRLLAGVTPDFVVMFIPNEPAFLEALRYDQSLYMEAYDSKVIIASPTNLMAVLKIVSDLWKRDDQNRNALAIADEGAKLYDKFVGFLETLEGVGKGISTASTRYDDAIKQLSTGSGNLIGRTEKLRKLGVKASKRLPSQFADNTPSLTDDSGEE